MKRSQINNRNNFTLTGVNAQEIINKYIDNFHQTIEIDNIKCKKSIKINTVKEKENLTNSPYEKKYFINSNTLKQTIHTTNNDQFKLVIDGKQLSEIKFRCFYCRVDRKQISLGFPIKIEVELDKYIFHLDEPYYCNYNCLYSGMDDKFKDNREERDLVEENIKFMFHLSHPDEVLTKAKDWRLHEVNHGTLNDEQFNDETFEYIKLPSIITLPVKRQYIQYKIK